MGNDNHVNQETYNSANDNCLHDECLQYTPTGTSFIFCEKNWEEHMCGLYACKEVYKNNCIPLIYTSYEEYSQCLNYMWSKGCNWWCISVGDVRTQYAVSYPTN